MAATRKTAPPLTAQAFIAKLLAPLPEGEEPVRSASFVRQIAKDLRPAWYAQLRQVRLAEARHKVTVYESMPDCGGGAGGTSFKRYLHEVGKLMLAPCPTREQLRDKKALRKLGGGSPEWEAAILRDEARLLGR
jgi:hypothetical protein